VKTGKRYVEVDHFGMAKYKEYLAKKTQVVPEQQHFDLPDFGDIQ
jgi:hypothetical protein